MNGVRILAACEESQAVTIAFRAKGFEAYSCDIQACSGNHPEWHIQGDVTEVLKDHWDAIIAFPPCTYLTNASAVRMRVNGYIIEERYNKMIHAREFFLQFYEHPCKHIAIENPVPMRICQLPKYNQIIQPYEYGHPYRKRTCLWLKGLPMLQPTCIIEHHEPYINGGCKDKYGNYRRFQGRRERDQKTRSKTFTGIAQAMAEQWGNYLLNTIDK